MPMPVDCTGWYIVQLYYSAAPLNTLGPKTRHTVYDVCVLRPWYAVQRIQEMAFAAKTPLLFIALLSFAHGQVKDGRGKGGIEREDSFRRRHEKREKEEESEI